MGCLVGFEFGNWHPRVDGKLSYTDVLEEDDPLPHIHITGSLDGVTTVVDFLVGSREHSKAGRNKFEQLIVVLE